MPPKAQPKPTGSRVSTLGDNSDTDTAINNTSVGEAIMPHANKDKDDGPLGVTQQLLSAFLERRLNLKLAKPVSSHISQDVPLLDKHQCNWELWCRKVKIALESSNLNQYVYGTLPMPSEEDNKEVWLTNNKFARVFLISCCSDEEQREMEQIDLASELYTCLRSWHKQEGEYLQLLLIQEVLHLQLDRGTQLASQYQKAQELIKHIFNIAPITAKSFLR